MITLDILRVALRWVHLGAAVVWIGGTFFYLLAVRPAILSPEAAAGWRKLRDGVERQFHEIVRLCVWTFFISGAILTYDRLTSVNPSLDYIVVLVIKVILVGWMVFIAGGLRRSAPPAPAAARPKSDRGRPGLLRRWSSPAVRIAIVGSIVLLLAGILNVVAENAIRTQ